MDFVSFFVYRFIIFFTEKFSSPVTHHFLSLGSLYPLFVPLEILMRPNDWIHSGSGVMSLPFRYVSDHLRDSTLCQYSDSSSSTDVNYPVSYSLFTWRVSLFRTLDLYQIELIIRLMTSGTHTHLWESDPFLGGCF